MSLLFCIPARRNDWSAALNVFLGLLRPQLLCLKIPLSGRDRRLPRHRGFLPPLLDFPHQAALREGLRRTFGAAKASHVFWDFDRPASGGAANNAGNGKKQLSLTW